MMVEDKIKWKAVENSVFFLSEYEWCRELDLKSEFKDWPKYSDNKSVKTAL